MDTINNNITFFSVLPSSLLPEVRKGEGGKEIERKKDEVSAIINGISTLSTQPQKEKEKEKEKETKVEKRCKRGRDKGNVVVKKLENVPFTPQVITFEGFTFKVDVATWEADLRYLASLNRYAKAHDSQIHKAGEWLEERMKEINNVVVERQNVMVNDVYESFNVIGTLKGTTHPDTYFVIGAHYDSTSENPKVTAPGALDNASGSAAVLEMARIFSKTTFPFSIVFILFTGEEQGFFGSKKYVQGMFVSDLIPSFMLNMDMISLDPLIIIETREQSVVDIWKELAEKNSLIPQVELNIWGSDHVTFANAGVPSILTCSDHSKYPHYHRTTDLPENLHILSGYNTIVMNVQGFISQMKISLQYL